MLCAGLQPERERVGVECEGESQMRDGPSLPSTLPFLLFIEEMRGGAFHFLPPMGLAITNVTLQFIIGP